MRSGQSTENGDDRDANEHAPCGFVSIHTDGTILYANATFGEMVGCPREALVGTAFFDRLTVAGRLLFETHLRPLLRLRGSIREAALDLQCHSGECLPVTVNATERGDGARGAVIRLALFAAGCQRENARTLEERSRQDERQRIARELHDELGQLLTALKFDLRAAREAAANSESGATIVRDAIGSMETLSDDALDAMDRIISDLRPQLLCRVGLGGALEWCATEFERRTAIRARVQISCDTARIGAAASAALFRIVQEALTNVARHAEASDVGVTLHLDQDTLVLSVRDNGRGPGPGRLVTRGGYGLLGMRERLQNIGGTLTLRDAVPHGTELIARCPHQ